MREGRRAGLSESERDELRRLRRENKRLHVERDILGEAAAWFARETGLIPSREQSRGTHGAPGVQVDLRAQGTTVGMKRVARLMKAAELQGVSRRRG